MTKAQLVELNDFLTNCYLGDELRIFTKVFLEEVKDNLHEQIEAIENEILWRESKNAED